MESAIEKKRQRVKRLSEQLELIEVPLNTTLASHGAMPHSPQTQERREEK